MVEVSKLRGDLEVRLPLERVRAVRDLRSRGLPTAPSQWILA